MTSTATASTSTASTSIASASQNGTASVSALTSDQGQTRVADVVVSKITGLAAREVPGVYALGGGAARAFDALRERIPGATSNVSHGVSVEVGERQAAVDLNVVVEYGVGIVEVAGGVRRNVIDAIERMTGLQVVEVNIAVGDVHLPADEHTQAPAVPSTPRVA